MIRARERLACVRKHAHWYRRLTPRVGLLLLIIAYAVFLRCLDFFDPWPDNITGYNGAYNSLSARNYLRYGYRELQLAQYWEGGPINSSSYVYYNHPPLVPLLVSFSFKLFNTYKEWSARLVPLIFSMATLFVLYLLVKKIWTERIALLACFVAAVTPMAAYYATNVCYEAISIFSFLLVLYFYLAYLRRPGARSLTFMLLSLSLGALNDWPIFFAVPLLCAHYLFSVKGKKRSFLIFPTFAGLVFVLVASRAIEGGSVGHIFGILFQYLAKAETSELEGSKAITVADWFKTVLSYHLELYTLPILILFLVWLIRLIIRMARKENLAKDTLIVILILFGLLNIGLGWQWAVGPGHEYWASLSMPGLAIAAAVILDKAYERFIVTSRKSLYLKSLFYILLLAFAVYCTQKLYSFHYFDDRWYEFGAVINRNSDFNELVLTSEALEEPTALFYADRNLRGNITDPHDFSKVYYDDPEAGRVGHFFMRQAHQVSYTELYRFLELAFDCRREDDFFIFDLKSKKISDAAIKSSALR